MCQHPGSCKGSCTEGALCEATEQEVELVLLRRLYEQVRGVLRHDGVNPSRAKAYYDSLDVTVEEVKKLDGGQYDGDDVKKLLMGNGFVSMIYRTCHAYESGMGHGLQADGFDNRDGDLFSDPRENEAFKLGYRQGLRLRKAQGQDVATREVQRLDAQGLTVPASGEIDVAGSH